MRVQPVQLITCRAASGGGMGCHMRTRRYYLMYKSAGWPLPSPVSRAYMDGPGRRIDSRASARRNETRCTMVGAIWGWVEGEQRIRSCTNTRPADSPTPESPHHGGCMQSMHVFFPPCCMSVFVVEESACWWWKLTARDPLSAQWTTICLIVHRSLYEYSQATAE